MSVTAVKAPCFLVGAERSGTTLLRLMLDCHPEVAFNLESEYLVSRIDAIGEFPNIISYREWLMQDRVFSSSKFNIDTSLDFPRLLNDFLEQKRKRDGKETVGATVHYGFSKLKFIWPNAKYIYIYRDPRDVVSSVMNIGWAGNVWVAADWWLEAETEWKNLKADLIPEQWMEIKYENLVRAPTDELRSVCDFMEIAYSDRMFDYTKFSSYDYPDPSLASKWQLSMHPSNAALVEAKLSHLMISRGYKCSVDNRAQPSFIRKGWLTTHSKMIVIARRIERFGVLLYVQQFLAKKLGLSHWSAKLKVRMDAIIDSQTK